MRLKPVAIFQHTEVGQPGAVIPVLNDLSVPWEIIPIKDGVPVPDSPEPYSGLIFMGGAMGVNDGLSWVEDQKRLIIRAHEAGLPVAGHCLGSQIVAAAFGADIRKNKQVEIGWQTVGFTQTDLAREWFGTSNDSCVFQWHADTFDLPQGAIRLASNPYCDNQAFLLHDRHLGMQFHLEMTPELVKLCLEANGRGLDRELAAGNPAVNPRDRLLARLSERTEAMHRLIRPVYTRWVQGLKK